MAETQSCAVCGCETGGGSANEPCPKCLLSLGVGNDPEEGNQTADLAYLLAEPRTSGAVKFFSFGKYELLEEIARGGMGVVFRAWDKTLQRVVALKFLRREALASSAGLQRFRLEAKTAASLRHAHIVPIHEFGEQDGYPYVTMDFMKESLADQVAKRNGTAPDFLAICDAVSIVVKIAGALQYAHAKGVLHRDIKPGNILLDEHGEPHLTDFGLAKLLDVDGGLTVKGEVIGTPSYISPEQAQGSSALTPATDVYGLGATLYELITGSPPFAESSKLETLNMVLQRMPARPRALNPAVPRALEVILRTCLAKRQAERYATGAELATDLKWFLDNRLKLQSETEEGPDIEETNDSVRPQIPPMLARTTPLYLAMWNREWTQTTNAGSLTGVPDKTLKPKTTSTTRDNPRQSTPPRGVLSAIKAFAIATFRKLASRD